MPTLLNIQSSPRGANSLSRTVSQDFVAAWQTKHPDGKVVLRDLAANDLPFVSLQWIAGIYSPVEALTPDMRRALAVSDELIAELFAADEILIGAPMYNFAVPANLKAWIDMVVRPRVTHTGPPARTGLVTGKRCKIVIASGGSYDAGLPAAASDYESGYLRRILGFIGITDIEVILAGGSAAIALGSATVEQLAAQYRPSVLASIA